MAVRHKMIVREWLHSVDGGSDFDTKDMEIGHCRKYLS